jgi:hypothetical protein
VSSAMEIWATQDGLYGFEVRGNTLFPVEDGDCSVIAGRGTCAGVPLCESEETEVEEEGRGEEEGGRDGDTTGVVLYMGRLGLLSFLFTLS